MKASMIMMKLKAHKTTRWRPSSLSVVFLSSITEALKVKFHTTMINKHTRIFSSWVNFENSLPRRTYNNAKTITSYLPLYTHNYYARDDDLQRFADEIMKPPEQLNEIRRWVKYITAKPSSVRAASVSEDDPNSLYLYRIQQQCK
jgi:hypothetical protein